MGITSFTPIDMLGRIYRRARKGMRTRTRMKRRMKSRGTTVSDPNVACDDCRINPMNELMCFPTQHPNRTEDDDGSEEDEESEGDNDEDDEESDE